MGSVADQVAGSGGQGSDRELSEEGRRAVIVAARHSNGMEGGQTTPAARAVQDGWVRGELSLEQFRDRVVRDVTVGGRPRPAAVADRSLFYAASPEGAYRFARSGQLPGSSAEVELLVLRGACPGGTAVAVAVPAEAVRRSDVPGRVVVAREVIAAARIGRAFQPWHADVEPDVRERWKGYLQPEMTLTLRNLVGADTPLTLRQRKDEFVELGLAELAVRPVPQIVDLAHLQAIGPSPDRELVAQPALQ